MKNYRLKICHRVSHIMSFTVRAESLAQAHKIGEADVRAGKHPIQSTRVDVTVLECHGEVDDVLGGV